MSSSSSRAGRVAVVAGLVALGVTEGAEARAEDREAPRESSPSLDGAGSAPAAKKGVAKPRAKVDAGLVATLPGFQMLPDGGSRLFVALTHNANVSEKRDPRTLTYVIHGAHVVHRNNENALVTVHFNTPVTRARLLPSHGDLVFTVELRADTAPTWRLADAGDGSSVLQIDFPKGTFLPPGEYDASAAPPDPNAGEVQMAPGAARRPPSPSPTPPPAPPPPAGGPPTTPSNGT
jgi:hypothetical protein